MSARSKMTAALVVPAAVLALALAGCTSGADGESGSGGIGEGITEPVNLPPFVPSDDAGKRPDLPKVVAFAQGTLNETEQAIANGLKLGAEGRGLEFIQANAEGQPTTQVQNMSQFLVRGVGALVSAPTDPAAQASVIKDAMDKGVAAMNLVFGPGTNQVNASQYAVGETIARVAVKYIETKLGGKANVVLLNQDELPPIKPRFEAVRKILAEMPGVKIVADVTPDQPNAESGAKAMNTILQANPHIDVVIASDGPLTGALSAFEAADRVTDDLFLGGLDGTPSALEAIKKGGPLKATVGLSPSVFGYAWGQYAADWLEGRSIPQAINVVPVPIASSEDVTAYEADQAGPSEVWNDPDRLSKYLQMFGSISYETRQNYLAYNWSISK